METSEFFPTLLRSWGGAGNDVTAAAESTVGNVARWSHRLAAVALAVGFAAQPQFTTAFGRATGLTPGQWRRERLS